MSPFVSVRFLATQSDARLLALARRGHERAFEALVHRYRRPLLAHCRRLLGSQERAEDGLQQGLMQAWIALQQGTEVREARPWLYRVVHNASLNLLRGRVETAGLEEALEGASSGEIDAERRLAVRDALASVAALPLLQREALLRTAVGGDSHEQVAAALGLSDGAVRGLIYRARATLRAGMTAVTPAPVANWMAATAARRPSPPLSDRLAELLGGGGSAGASAALLKGGAAVITAGAVAAGVAAPVVHLGAKSPQAATAATAAPRSSHSRANSSRDGAPSAASNLFADRIGSRGPQREARPAPGRPGGSRRAPGTPGDARRGGDARPVQISGTGTGGGAAPSGSGSGSTPGGSGSTPGGSGSSSGGSGSSSGGPGPSSGGSGSSSGGSGSTPGGSGSTSGGSGSSSGGSGSTSGGPGPTPSGGSDGGVSGSSGSSDDLLRAAPSGSGTSGSGTSGSSDGISGGGGTSGTSTRGGSTGTSGSSTTTGTSGPH